MSVTSETRVRTLALSEAEVAVREVGSDVPVLLLHEALGRAAPYFEPGSLAEQIAARGCRVIGFDLPGHGEPGTFETAERIRFDAETIEEVAARALEILDVQGVEQAAAAIGVGFGGLVALRLGAILPRRVGCVVADSPPGLTPDAPAEPWSGASGVAHPLGTAWDAFVARLDGEDPYGWLAGTIQVPALITIGAQADDPSTERLFDVARRLPAQVALLPGAGPPAYRSARAFFLREVERFLAAHG
ncbi:MAG: alpha/beta fold hydrolase [Acidobacteria bacterium]|nr:MAG: alpha/beta fold hydrolase [Acidobacteriota bacterium]